MELVHRCRLHETRSYVHLHVYSNYSISPLVHTPQGQKNRETGDQYLVQVQRLHPPHYSHKGVEVPVGWERYSYYPELPLIDIDKRRFPDYNVPQYFYKHNSDEMAEFWYPIPIREAAEEPISLDNLPFISCRTTRCWLDAAENNLHYSRLWVSLRDGAGILAGVLNVHDLNFSIGPCELISISMGYACGGRMDDYCLAEQNTKLVPRSNEERYDFYNVLWIEWEDGIAFRKGVGRVKKSMWDAQPLEWIDVTLG